ncbi:MAG: hypothetical protein ABIS20_24010 [Thermoanaerobaculia bacterium]
MRDDPRDPEEDETPGEVEKILRALADQDPDDALPAPGDERLRAWREGRLNPVETAELESLLARSAAGRRRLLELAGVDRSLPLRRVRKAVLAGAGRPRRMAPWISAAAAVAASIVLTVLTFFPRPHGLPAGLAYDVGAQGLAEVRSAGELPSVVRAYPATPVRILVRPRGDSPAGVSFALFRREGEALRRVRQPEEVRLVSDRGSAAFEGTAARVLATRAPGAHPLYVVAYNLKEPPPRVELAPGQDPAAALRDSGRLVYPVTVNLLGDEPPAKDGMR